jgi:protein gp37
MPMPHNRYACIQDWDGTVAEFPERWAEPLHWRAPQRVFVGSRSDIALWSDVQWVNLMSIMRATPRHRYLLLTKRPRAVGMWVECCGPLPLNVWAGVTVCNQNEAEEKIPELLRIPAAGYWLSIEPMLSAVSIVEEHVCQDENCGHARLGWVVAGGESGPGDRRMEVAWVRDLRYQCLKSGTPFYFKQWSDANPGSRFEPSGMPVLDGVVDAAIPHALLVPAKEHGVMR